MTSMSKKTQSYTASNTFSEIKMKFLHCYVKHALKNCNGSISLAACMPFLVVIWSKSVSKNFRFFFPLNLIMGDVRSNTSQNYFFAGKKNENRRQ